MSSHQADIFDYSIRSTVDDVLNGYNGTVFAYGQTGAGKSYTMMGDMEDERSKGIIPRIVEQLFSAIFAAPPHIEYTVRVGYLEIYMERIRDLLNPANDNLPVHEEKNRGVYVKGLVELYVASVGEVYTIMQRGQKARVVAATNMNQESSRSHSIFVITITQKDTSTGSQKSGTLYLVDLAGSEKVGKTGASGQTLEEAKKINKSLSALGMVINSLTDGKSSHIPYRDSKLTRILQESLGGNSRTTLIINCSPSSYNDAETLSTLRFGMRAKSIKNKAKVNAELSPAELKRQLKTAQTQIMTFEKYISNIDTEVQVWRSGETVPRDRWVPPFGKEPSTKAGELRSPRPETPSRQLEVARSETPARSDSRLGDRSSTPSVILEKDEREEFLKRENELQDQLAEKETQASNAEKMLQETREELKSLRENNLRTNKDNEAMTEKLNRAELELQKISFQSREDSITMDSLKEANRELETEMDSIRQQLLDVKMSAKETNAALDEKERKKQDRMAKMMAGFNLGGDAFSENERKIQVLLEQIDSLHQTSSAGEAVAPDSFEQLRAQLVETQGFVRQAELHLNDRTDLTELQDSKRLQLEQQIAAAEKQYQDLLEKNLSEADIEEVKERLAKAYADQIDSQAGLVEDLRTQLTQRSEELSRLRKSMTEAQSRQANGAAPNGGVNKTLQQQITDFDIMKKSLMRDLQNRCERVVELEISLDETREQYNNVLKSSNNRQQQKKMAFLERNLEQLTVVQRQLVEQNTSLKKEVAIAERKLIARNERIVSLESLLQDSQEKLTAANHR